MPNPGIFSDNLSKLYPTYGKEVAGHYGLA
jgi:hypothetical protein